jgi:hypothetical protein
MLANLKRNVSLWLSETTGITAGFLIFGAIAVVTTLIGFIFLCVTGYVWTATELGPVFGGLASAGVFLAIAACSFVIASSSRSGAKHRAALERSRRAQGGFLLMNPKTLRLVMQAGRHIGWQRLIPIALLGFLATQFAREQRRRESDDLSQCQPKRKHRNG